MFDFLKKLTRTKLARDKRGNITTTIFAIALPLMMGTLELGVEEAELVSDEARLSEPSPTKR